MRPLLVLLACVGCGSEPAEKSPASSRGPVDSGTPDDSPPDDSDDSDDMASGDTGDSGAPLDSSDSADTALPPCSEGLQVRQEGEEVVTELSLGEAPARSWSMTVTLELHNPCEDELRFLGHPDEWVSGTDFALESLPPVRLLPGESASLSLSFSPGDPGESTGRFTLPYDQLGSPFDVVLQGTAGDPLLLVLAGEGRRVSTSPDYGDSWSTDAWDTLVGHTNSMQRGGCYGAGTFVTVGGSDSMHWWTSTDGDSWTAYVEEEPGALGDCAFGDGGFVAYGSGLYTSADGVDWTYHPTDYNPDHLRGMTHGIDASGAHRFVAVGDAGRVAVTLDGATWEVDANPVSGDLNELAFGVGTAGPVWVAVGDDGLVATSPDGESWTEQVVGSGEVISRVAFGDEVFLLGDGAAQYVSLDGYSWSLVGASPVGPLAQLGQMWFGADGAALYRSEDRGTTWSEVRSDDGGPGYAVGLFATEGSL